MRIEKGTYEEYVKLYGDSPLALNIKNNNCDLYFLYKDDELIDKIVVFTEENNLVNLNICLRPFKEYLEYTICYLSSRYSNIILELDENTYGKEIFNTIRSKYKAATLPNNHELSRLGLRIVK